MTAVIKQVEVFNVNMPLVGTFTSGGKSYDHTKCVVVRVTDADSATGISSIARPSCSSAQMRGTR